MFKLSSAILISIAVSGCATALLAAKRQSFSWADGSTFQFVRTGCAIGDGEFLNKGNKTRTLSMSIIATNNENRTVAEWGVHCNAAVVGGAATCKIYLKSEANFFTSAGGMGCPDIKSFSTSHVSIF